MISGFFSEISEDFLELFPGIFEIVAFVGDIRGCQLTEFSGNLGIVRDFLGFQQKFKILWDVNNNSIFSGTVRNFQGFSGTSIKIPYFRVYIVRATSEYIVDSGDFQGFSIILEFFGIIQFIGDFLYFLVLLKVL